MRMFEIWISCVSFKYFQRAIESCCLKCFYQSLNRILRTWRAVISWGVDETHESALTPCPASPALATMQQMAKQPLSSKYGKALDMECICLVIPDGLYRLFCFLNSVMLSNLFTELYLLLTPALPTKMTFISHHNCLNSFSVYTKYWKCIIGYGSWEPPGIL